MAAENRQFAITKLHEFHPLGCNVQIEDNVTKIVFVMAPGDEAYTFALTDEPVRGLHEKLGKAIAVSSIEVARVLPVSR